MEKRRMSYIDIGKGIGIFLVVLGHTYRRNIVQIGCIVFICRCFSLYQDGSFAGVLIRRIMLSSLPKKHAGCFCRMPYS